jgi:hypothetical protein
MQDPDTRKRSWHLWTLLAALLVNACAHLAYVLVPLSLHGNSLHPFTMILLFIAIALTTVGILIAHVGVVWFWKFRLLRYFFYTLPSIVLMVWSLSLPESPVKPNQIDNLVSPSGDYRLTMPIRDDVWKVTIYNRAGQREYQDADSHFGGFFNVYWTWDSQDRVWLYNSDDGKIYWWSKSDGQWNKNHWGHILERETPMDIEPPEMLVPDPVKKRARQIEIENLKS